MNRTKTEKEMIEIMLKIKRITKLKEKINLVNIPTTMVIFNIKIMLRLGKKTIKLGKTKIDNSKIINIKMMSFSKEDKMKKKCLRMIKKRSTKINFNLMMIRLIKVKGHFNKAKSSL
jgi:hypothetical protein